MSDLLVFLHPAQEDNHTIMAPESFISSLVHPGMLLLPSAEGVGHKAVSSHGWLTLVASCQHDAADVQLPRLPYTHSTISQLQLQEGNVLDGNLTVLVKSQRHLTASGQPWKTVWKVTTCHALLQATVRALV